MDSTSHVVAVNPASGYATSVTARSHTATTDEPASLGGTDTGMTPVELVLGALASCTAITIRMYASRKGWSVGEIRVSVEPERDGAGRVTAAAVRVSLAEVPDEAQRARLLQIAGKCPVHRMLAEGIAVRVEGE